ncbi:hypothetical protein D3C85_1902380 [compost metagenome]
MSFKLAALASFLSSFGVDVGKITRLLINLILIQDDSVRGMEVSRADGQAFT